MSSPVKASSDDSLVISVEALAKRNITVQSQKTYYYSHINIVIGPNGAGKTRFLNTVRDAYADHGKFDILYGYFPDLSPSGRGIISEDLPDVSLEEFMESSDVSFNDFFKEIESQYSTLLDAILTPKSKKKDREYTRFLASVNEFFSAFTGKSVIKMSQTTFGRRSRPLVPKFFVKDPYRAGELPLEQALKEFSPGERMLLYMSLFLALRKEPAKDRGQVIILDEPEAHLHPDALIKFVKGLEEKFPKADIWIATHSLYLLPLHKFENIVYLENGKLLPRSSKLYQNILSSMLGPYSDNINDFFASLPQWQYCEFIAECFTNPEVVDIPDPADPQVEIFIKAMREKKLRKILDYGGGSGRLGRSVEAASACEWEKLEYHICDKNPRGVKGIKVFDKLENADSDYDCAVMMNVLHEVEPSEWRKTFLNLYSRICIDGCLLFVEASALTNGEYPNDAGYFLLCPGELKTLFNLENNPTEISVEKEGKKYCGYLIPRSALNKVTEQSVAGAVRMLELRTLLDIKGIRSQGQDKANSRRYAFLLQQHMNAALYLEKIK